VDSTHPDTQGFGEPIPAWWHQAFTEVRDKIARETLEEIDQDWPSEQARYEALLPLIGHSEDLDAALAADPKSWQNVRRQRNADGKDETDP
jgi:hypothetical protein